MAAPLKDFFDERLARRIALSIKPVYADFPGDAFVAEATKGLAQLELLDRGKHFADALAKSLPSDYERAVDILLRSVDVPLDKEGGSMSAFFYLPHVTLVSKWGLDHFDASMRAQYVLTQKFSAEFSIRYFILRDPGRTLAVLHSWTNDANEHVRRLVSEGTRPRLPWAVRLPPFIQNPAPVLELLEKLRDDPALYVRRSVANSLNDIAKDHPDLVVDVCGRWSQGASAERKWIIRHALRWLVKRGHVGAIQLLGGGTKPKVRIESIAITPNKVTLGSSVAMAFDLVSEAKKSQELVVDYVMHHPGATGKMRSKVFKLRRVKLEPQHRLRLEGRISLVDRTIRKHHPGLYRIDLRIGGTDFALGSFEAVVAKTRSGKTKLAQA
ncbi:MAG TPA: DNA alkylation repair protein [Polyangium sp.]|nr:DNA alkylation repair protein [Polyangium sp.]